ncbi:MAG: hypothetical protein ACK559_03055, partial [bacterium]
PHGRTILPYRTGPTQAHSTEKLFYATELADLALDKTDFSVDFIAKENGLSQAGIRLIRFSPSNKRLVIVYNNSVLDILQESGEVLTLNQIRNFRNFTGDKYIYDLLVADDSTLFIAANYGISRLNPVKGEFGFTTFTGLDVFSVAVFEGFI